MNNLKKTLIAACSFVLVGVSTSALAGSDNFAGPYIGLSISGYGLGVDGHSKSTKASTQGTNDSGDDPETDVQIGKVAAVSGGEVGYALPLGDSLLIDIGASYLAGEAKMDYVADDVLTSQANVALKVDDLRTYYIAPTLVISDTASVYVKVGLSEADIGVSGDVTTPADLSGTTWGIGTRIVLDSGLFIRSEAGYTDYNGISSQGKGNDQASTTSYSAKPTTAYGQFSMGFRF
jgi:hypothetical protein